MTDTTPATDLAARLRARGVTLRVRNNRLWLLPPHAYKTLSDEDRAILRHHRDELKAIAEAGLAERPPRLKQQQPEPKRVRATAVRRAASWWPDFSSQSGALSVRDYPHDPYFNEE